jgi:hypothetical protein
MCEACFGLIQLLFVIADRASGFHRACGVAL